MKDRQNHFVRFKSGQFSSMHLSQPLTLHQHYTLFIPILKPTIQKRKTKREIVKYQLQANKL